MTGEVNVNIMNVETIEMLVNKYSQSRGYLFRNHPITIAQSHEQVVDAVRMWMENVGIDVTIMLI